MGVSVEIPKDGRHAYSLMTMGRFGGMRTTCALCGKTRRWKKRDDESCPSNPNAATDEKGDRDAGQ